MQKRFLQFGFPIEGEKEISGVLEFIGEELKDFREPLRESRKILVKAFQTNFKSEGKTLGEPWQKLSPQYAKWKARKFSGKGILRRTGKMAKSFKHKTTKIDTTIFNAAKYFPFHQSNQPRSKMPRRIMMKIDQTRRIKIFSAFTEYLNKVASNWK